MKHEARDSKVWKRSFKGSSLDVWQKLLDGIIEEHELEKKKKEEQKKDLL